MAKTRTKYNSKRPLLKDLTGMKIGKWSVISDTGKRSPTIFLCQCECGNYVEVRSGDLINGHSKCCVLCRAKKHGDTGTKIHRAWRDMKGRCNNETHKCYHRYGGRGISICKEWNDSYVAFKEWSLKNGFCDNLTIDRIDNNGNYEPSNCRWTTWVIQNRNKNYTKYTVNGVTKTLGDWTRYYKIPYITVYQRLRFQGQSIERALRI